VTDHLTVRVPWHDSRWNGRICSAPSKNAFCVDLDRIRLQRDDAAEEAVAERPIWTLDSAQHPPCIAESGMFMNDQEWWRLFRHPYQDVAKLDERHGRLRPTKVRIPPYSTFAVPFNWMLRESQERIQESVPDVLPPDGDPPFSSPWVFSAERQEAICDLVFGRLVPNESLVFFYP
jgi:hypothetical protein